MSHSDSSALSSAPTTDDESIIPTRGKDGLLQFLSKAPPRSPSPDEDERPVQRKRAASPPHEYVLADDPDIAFIVMFRSRFNECFPKSLSHYGPQDIENGVVSTVPGEHVENLLCALIALVLNRKKWVERGHYQRALEEAISTHTPHWPRSWQNKNPLHGGNTFAVMSPTDRLTLLKTLILWALASSDAVQAVIKDSYKQARHDDDLNQPLSVQVWGQDGDKRRYWLIEGQDDTNFRLYRESNIKLKNNTWWSIAGGIEELKVVGEHLTSEGSQAARRLSERINMAIPRFEATEEKRRRREYRIAQKARFRKPEPGFSMYEGRTRGKKIRYTFSSEEDEGSDAPSNNRRSTRHSGVSTPAEPEGPTFTASGRQVKSRHGGAYGETMLSGQQGTAPSNGTATPLDDGEEGAPSNGRPRRSALRQELGDKIVGGDHIEGYNSIDEIDDEEDAASSGDDYAADDDDADVDMQEEDADEDEEMSEDDMLVNDRLEAGSPDRSLVVQLRYQKRGAGAEEPVSAPPITSTTETDAGPVLPVTRPTSPPVAVNSKELDPRALVPTIKPTSPPVAEFHKPLDARPFVPATKPVSLSDVGAPKAYVAPPPALPLPVTKPTSPFGDRSTQELDPRPNPPARKPSITNFFKPISVEKPIFEAPTQNSIPNGVHEPVKPLLSATQEPASAPDIPYTVPVPPSQPLPVAGAEPKREP